MNLSYSLLAVSAFICLFTSNRKIALLSIVVTSIVASLQGVVSIVGLLYISFFGGINYIYFRRSNLSNIVKTVLLLMIILLAGGLMFHIIPGFNNALVIDKLEISELSRPFSMYLNFDRTIAGLILYGMSGLAATEKYIDRKSAQQTILILLACIVTILVPGLLSGYINFDFKIPSILMIWSINNLLFVCSAEEVMYRGFLQNQLRAFCSGGSSIKYLHIIIAAIIFGLAHFKGGAIYVVLASIAGWFYGYTYEKTRRIFCSMLVHFGLNLTHLIFFTYPASV